MVIYYIPLWSYEHIWTESNAFYLLFAKNNKVCKLQFIIFLSERMRILNFNGNSNCC